MDLNSGLFGHNSLLDGGKISLLKLNNYTITTSLSISFPINLYVQNRKVEQSILCQNPLNEIYNKLLLDYNIFMAFNIAGLFWTCSLSSS